MDDYDDAAALCAMELEALDATYGAGCGGEGEGGGCGGANCAGDDEGGAGAGGADSAAPPFCTLVRPAPPTSTGHLTPRGVGLGARFCDARLTLAAPEGYPTCAAPIAVSLSHVRGLGDARRAALLAGLAAEAGALAGDAALGTLIEAGLDGVTALNAPEGDCPLCLGPLLPGGEGGAGGDAAAAAVAAVMAGAPAAAGDPPKGLLKLAGYPCLHL